MASADRATVPAGAEEKLVAAIRPRPLTGDMPDAGLRLTPGGVEVSGEGALLFDRVFAAEADNGVVYGDVAAPVVAAVLRGISGAVAAYGQTGSGKTRTMRGVADDPGLVPRAVCAIFEHVRAQAGVREFKVSLSYFEIYNETLKDLLCPSAKLDVVEGLAGVDVRGARPTEVADLAAALRLLDVGDACRATAATAMNAQSSRSHCIARITVESKKANAGMESRGLVAVLSMVDLAGSESAVKTGHTSGARALEGAKINQSLFALSRVIEALSRADGSKPPFRDSKLTRLLKSALEPGASSKTALICCINPAAEHATETQSTLQFAKKARCVKTRSVVREELSERDRARQLAEENEALQAALAQREAESAAAAAAAAETAGAEAGAQRAEAAAAAERLVAVEAEAAELRGRIARMNAAAVEHAPTRLPEQPGAPDAAVGDSTAMRAARRATLACPSDAAAAKVAAATAAAPPALEGPEIIVLLAATQAALAAEKAERAETQRRNDKLTGEKEAALTSQAIAEAMTCLVAEKVAAANARAEDSAREAAALRERLAQAESADKENLQTVEHSNTVEARMANAFAQDKAGYKNLLADYRKGSVETIDGIKENRAPGGRLRIVGVPGVEKIYRVFADHSRKKRKEIDELDGLLKKDAESVTAYTKAVKEFTDMVFSRKMEHTVDAVAGRVGMSSRVLRNLYS